jgi:hypothetical protein
VCWNRTCMTGPCDGICNDPEMVNMTDDGFRVDPLGTSARCFEVTGYEPVETNKRVVCWEFHNGRTFRVNGQTVPCLENEGYPMATDRAGGYCVQVGEGLAEFAGFLFPLR